MAILRAVATVDLPAVPRFVADEVFKPYDRKAPPYARSRVTFFFPMRNVMNREIYPNAPIFDDEPAEGEFRQHFKARIEENVPAATLTVWELVSETDPVEILRELGDRADLPLAHVYALLARQPRARAGLLRLDAINVCHVRSSHFGTRYPATGRFDAHLAWVSMVAREADQRTPSGWSLGVLESVEGGERWPTTLAFRAVRIISR